MPTLESKAAGSGRTLVEVLRDERYKFTEAKYQDRSGPQGQQQRPKNNKAQNQRKRI